MFCVRASDPSPPIAESEYTVTNLPLWLPFLSPWRSLFYSVSRVSIFLHFIIYIFSHELAYIVNEYSLELRTSSSLSETLFSSHHLFFLFFFLLCYFLNLSFWSYGISLLSLPFKFSPICCCFILPAFSLLSLLLLWANTAVTYVIKSPRKIKLNMFFRNLKGQHFRKIRLN